MNLENLRDDILIKRYEELVLQYEQGTEKLEKFLEEFTNIRTELLLIEEEIQKRKQNEKSK